MAVGCGPAERDGCAGGGCLDVVGDQVEGGDGAAQEAHADGAHDAPFSRLRGWLVRPAACPRGRIGWTGVHRLPPGVTLSGVRAGPDTRLAESVHMYNCRS